MALKLIEEFETTQCTIKVYDTGFMVDYHNIYMVKSYHHKNGKTNVRFGNKTQVKGIVKTYKKEKRFEL